VKHQLITPRNVDLIYPLDERLDAKPGLGGSAARMAAAAGSVR
jgi:hypothetical protein